MARIETLLKNIVADLQKEFSGIEAVILFGSYACGCVDKESDVDILVLCKRPKEDEIEVSHYIADDVTVELTIESFERFEREAKDGHPFALAVLRHGIPLYDKGAYQQLLHYKDKPVNPKFIRSWLSSAKKRLAEGDVRAAAIYGLNALLLSRNQVNISYKLKQVMDRTGVTKVDQKFVQQIIQEIEESFHGRKVFHRFKKSY